MNNTTRRQFSAGLAAVSASLILPYNAANAGVLDLLKLHPSRFFAGLAFNIAKVVFVRLAADFIVSRLKSGKSVYRYAGNSNYYQSTSVSYNPANYKSSLIMDDLIDYEIKQDLHIEAVLKSADEDYLRRLEIARQYLRLEKIPVAFWNSQQEASRLVREDEPFDNLLSVIWFDLNDAKKSEHYNRLIEETGNTVFAKL